MDFEKRVKNKNQENRLVPYFNLSEYELHEFIFILFPDSWLLFLDSI